MLVACSGFRAPPGPSGLCSARVAKPEAALEGCCRLGVGGAAAEVDVLGQAGAAVAEVVGDLAGGQAGLIEAVATVLRKVWEVTQG